MKAKLLFASIVVVALTALLAGAVAAQGPGPQVPPPPAEPPPAPAEPPFPGPAGKPFAPLSAAPQAPAYAAPALASSGDSPADAPYAPGVVIVRFAPMAGDALALRAPEQTTTGVTSLDRLGSQYGLRAATPLFPAYARQKGLKAQAGLPSQASLGDVYRLAFAPDLDVMKVVAACAADPIVIWAEPDYIARAAVAPNDPLYAQRRRADLRHHRPRSGVDERQTLHCAV